MDEKFFMDAMQAVGMEVVVVDENTPFGRQPQRVKVTIDGESEDVDFWMRHLMRAAGYKGDNVDMIHGNIFRICPRAVND